MELGQREAEVLAAIVREFIITGGPVGSQALVRDQGIHQSPATVRNVMAALEDAGFLCHPHTSAGRLPTDAGLRLYVNELMKAPELTQSEKKRIAGQYRLAGVDLASLLRLVPRLLSEVSQQCALVVVPRAALSRLERIEFLPLGGGRVVVVLMMDSRLVQNRTITLAEEPSGEQLERMCRYVNDLCRGKELREVRALVERELASEQTRYRELEHAALRMTEQAISGADDAEVLVEGQSRLLDHPALTDKEQLKALLRAVEEKSQLLRLLDAAIEADGAQVFIGEETGERQMKHCAVIAAAYGGDRPRGTLAVIGPASLDYARVISLVDFTAALLTQEFRSEER
jgi:heat-inducible transcriptional repressor